MKSKIRHIKSYYDSLWGVRMWQSQTQCSNSAVVHSFHFEQQMARTENCSIKEPSKTDVVRDLIHLDSRFSCEQGIQFFQDWCCIETFRSWLIVNFSSFQYAKLCSTWNFKGRHVPEHFILNFIWWFNSLHHCGILVFSIVMALKR